MAARYVDYLVPQIYWPLEGPPRFDNLATEWSSQRFGRSILLGIAAYKPEVKSQLNRIIEFVRLTDADGVAFFRYENIKYISFSTFKNVALPVDMEWIESDRPHAPINLTFNYDSFDPNIITLDWSTAGGTNSFDSTSYFALYSLPNRNSELTGENLFEVLPSDKTSIKLAIDKPKKINYYFTLKSLNKLWKESIESSNTIEITFRELSLAADMNAIFENPVIVKEENRIPKILLFSRVEDEIEIKDGEVKVLQRTKIFPGKNIFNLDFNQKDYSQLAIHYVNSGKVVKLNN